MGWAAGMTVGVIVMVLLTALAVAVHDHRRTHVPQGTMTARPLFPWSRALHHEALIVGAGLLGVVVLDHLVSAHAVPTVMRLGGWSAPPRAALAQHLDAGLGADRWAAGRADARVAAILAGLAPCVRGPLVPRPAGGT